MAVDKTINSTEWSLLLFQNKCISGYAARQVLVFGADEGSIKNHVHEIMNTSNIMQQKRWNRFK